jgi:hypothetical protein
MAQKRFFSWKDPIKTFELGEQFNGILQPGRYRGFDNITDAGGVGINIDVNHLTTGHTKTIENGSVISDLGIAMMPNGTVVHESAAIPALSVDSNAGIGNDRIDFIIAEHDYTPVLTGTPVTYSILKGPNTGLEPTIANPDNQIELGRIVIEANGTTFADILSYTPKGIPFLAEESAQSFRDKLEVLTEAEITALAVQRDLFKIAGDALSGTHIKYTPATTLTTLEENIEISKAIYSNKVSIAMADIEDGSSIVTDDRHIIELTNAGVTSIIGLHGIVEPTIPKPQHIILTNTTGKPIKVYNSSVSAVNPAARIQTPNSAQLYMEDGNTLILYRDTTSGYWVVNGGSTLGKSESDWVLDPLVLGDIGFTAGNINSASGSIKYKIIDSLVHVKLEVEVQVDSSIAGSWYVNAPVAIQNPGPEYWGAGTAKLDSAGLVKYYQLEIGPNPGVTTMQFFALDGTWAVGVYKIAINLTYEVDRP